MHVKHSNSKAIQQANAPSKRKSILIQLAISFVSIYCLSFIVLVFRIDLQQDSTSSKERIDTFQKKEISNDLNALVNYYTEKAVLTAYLETVDQEEWNIKPLPMRKNAQASKLKKVSYPELQSCKNLPSQWPVDNYPDDDPFLPWIHDVFPSNDGRFIHFIAQNKRRCHTGDISADIKKHMQPQVSLFQHIPVKRIVEKEPLSSNTRYKLTSHEDADPDGIQTRFICRFKPSKVETFSTFHVDYNYATFRKGGGFATLFSENAKDYNNHWNSQLIFNCPVPKELQEKVRSGSSVLRDYATLFLDLIPLRTPPRYGRADEFLPPKYEVPNTFNTIKEFGENHIFPRMNDSGRWENIPICKPSLQTYYNSEHNNETILPPSTTASGYISSTSSPSININHTLVAFTWTSKSFKTRKSSTVSDGERRLKEWITFHLLAGFDHIYVYDNTHAFDKNSSLQSVTGSFPSSKVTRINWPATICNNNPPGKDDRGERSSQYAAEASCLMKFGPHTKWMTTLDIDEYLIPMGKYKDMRVLLADLEKKDVKIYSFKSFRSRPVMSRLEPPIAVPCFGGRTCFQPVVPNNSSFLYTFNCEHEKPPKIKSVPAEKQIYRTDYVKLHFIHYSTITTEITKTKSELGGSYPSSMYKETKNRESNELSEATMIHTKTVPYEMTTNFEFLGKHLKSYFGFPWPNGIENGDVSNGDGFLYNCFVNEDLELYWLPKLHKALGVIN